MRFTVRTSPVPISLVRNSPAILVPRLLDEAARPGIGAPVLRNIGYATITQWPSDFDPEAFGAPPPG
jgi:hypothetical protein